MALATAMVMVNTVVIVQGVFDLQRDGSAFAFFAFGIGSDRRRDRLMPIALSVVEERRLMLAGAVAVAAGLLAGTFFNPTSPGLLLLWAVLGFGVAWALTPVTYLIRRIAEPADLQALFAAQMSIANGCLLVAYSAGGLAWRGTGAWPDLRHAWRSGLRRTWRRRIGLWRMARRD